MAEAKTLGQHPELQVMLGAAKGSAGRSCFGLPEQGKEMDGTRPVASKLLSPGGRHGVGRVSFQTLWLLEPPEGRGLRTVWERPLM